VHPLVNPAERVARDAPGAARKVRQLQQRSSQTWSIEMLFNVLVSGSVAGLVHFVVLGLLYGNPIIDKLYREAMATEPGVKKWPSKPRYLITQFLGTQLEVYLIAAIYWSVRPTFPIAGTLGTLTLGVLLAALRIYPRFWNMWIQSTYPGRLLAIELVNGTLATLVVIGVLQTVG
jgi:hypothetical protein